MKQVNIYTKTNIKDLKQADGIIACVLETEIRGETVTKEHFAPVQQATANQAELKALIAALGRLREPCNLTIYTESPYVAAGFEKGWVESWTEGGWLTARQKPVANREEWQEAARLLKPNSPHFIAGKHQYSRWLQREIEKRKEKIECSTDSENSTHTRN